MSMLQLFCLPFAGGSASVYTRWKKYIHPTVEIQPLEMAGRGRRFKEPFVESVKDATRDLLEQAYKVWNGKPFAFFGHSMGSLLAYEMIHQWRDTSGEQPVHAIFSGRYPPHINHSDRLLYLMPDEVFKEEILKFGGTSKEIFENAELEQLFIPILRADYKIIETYEYVDKEKKFDFDIHVFGGTRDHEVPLEELNEWSRYSSKATKVSVFDGGHFFINDRMEEVVDQVNMILTGSL